VVTVFVVVVFLFLLHFYNIGLEERSNLLHEHTSCFPQDSPDSLSGNMYSSWITSVKYREHNLKPPSKRCNYSKLRITSPFASDFEGLLGLEKVCYINCFDETQI